MLDDHNACCNHNMLDNHNARSNHNMLDDNNERCIRNMLDNHNELPLLLPQHAWWPQWSAAATTTCLITTMRAATTTCLMTTMSCRCCYHNMLDDPLRKINRVRRILAFQNEQRSACSTGLCSRIMQRSACSTGLCSRIMQISACSTGLCSRIMQKSACSTGLQWNLVWFLGFYHKQRLFISFVHAC